MKMLERFFLVLCFGIEGGEKLQIKEFQIKHNIFKVVNYIFFAKNEISTKTVI